MGRNFCVLKGESKPRFIFLQARKAEAGTGGRAETQQREGPLGGPCRTDVETSALSKTWAGWGGWSGSQDRVRHIGHCGDTNPRRSKPENLSFSVKITSFPEGSSLGGT